MIPHASEREISFWPATLPCRSRIELHCRCQINFGSKSSASQTQTTGTDDAVVASGKGNVVGGDESLVLGAGTRYAESGSIQAGGAANVGNVSIGSGANVNVGVGAEELTNLVDEITTASGDQVKSFTALADRQNQQLISLALREEESEKSKNQTLAWIAGGAFAVLALGLYLRER